MSSNKSLERIVAIIIREVGKLLELETISFETDMSFVDLGISSVQAVDIIESLNDTFHLQMGPEVVFDHPTIEALAAHMDEICVDLPSGDDAPERVSPGEPLKRDPSGRRTGVPPVDTSLENKDDIAVIGMAGRFPDAPDLDTFWKNLKQGVSSIREIPEDRWTLDDFFDPDPRADNRSYSRWGAFLADIDRFDALFFNISPTEAELTDPQQRLFLEEAMKAIENAGYRSGDLRRCNCGVFVGCRSGDYLALLNRSGVNLRSHAFMGNESSILAARISYYLDLKGPNMAVDTSCSSSLVALHMACESLRRKESDTALAGGVCLITTRDFYILASKAGILSPTGECRPFDNGADGFVPGEGVGVVVLKRLAEAIRDRDHIHAVLKGTGINHDGKTNSITAPSALSQTDLLCKVYDDYGIDPDTITCVETHGTATRLGDPIEITALTNAFRKYTEREKYCAVSSLKANIGHTITAAGLAGLIKLILCMKYKTMAPAVNFRSPNDHINFADSPFYVPTRPEQWRTPEGVPRRAALSSFGFSGTNAHVVLEEPPSLPEGETRSGRPCYFFPFSAKTPAALDRRLHDFGEWLGHEDTSSAVGDVAYTLLEGRHHYPHRCAVVAESLPDLKDALDLALAGRPGENFIRRENGADNRSDTTIRAAFEAWLIAELNKYSSGNVNTEDYRLKLMALADMYAGGRDPGALSIYDNTGCGRVPLPSYPFGGERHWVPKDKDTHRGPSNPVKTDVPDPPEARIPLYRPVWRQHDMPGGGEPGSRADSSPETVLFIHTREGGPLVKALSVVHAGDTRVEILLGEQDRRTGAGGFEVDRNDPEGFLQCMARYTRVDMVYFLGGILLTPSDPGDLDRFALQQDNGLTALFRLVRAMDGRGHLREGLRLKVVTNDACAILNAPIRNPSAAGLHGMCKSIAKEYPRVDVTCIDIALADIKTPMESASWRPVAAEIATTAGEPDGNEVALRHGVRYRRRLEPFGLPETSGNPFRPRGVYLIVGGAGGIGLALAGFLVETVDARLVLVGRSPLDEVKKTAVAGLATESGNVIYLRADVADPGQMRRVVESARERFGVIHGVFHLGMVLQDRTIARMSEREFLSVLTPKVRGSQVLYQALQNESLDFISFFSSVQSFAGYPGQGNYAAACAFKDAFSTYLNQHTAYPVQTINWGYWGDVGVVATESYRQGMEMMGYRSIGVEEGVRAVARAARHGAPQVVAMKASERVCRRLGVETAGDGEPASPGTLALQTGDLLNEMAPLPPGDQPAQVAAVMDALNDYGRWLVMDAFQQMGVFRKTREAYESPDLLASRLRVWPGHGPHFRMILNELRAAGFLRSDTRGNLITTERAEPAGLSTGREAARERLTALLETAPDLQPWPALLERCLKRYPEILTGEFSPLDVLFPKGSKELLENFYANNSIADAYNKIVAAALVPYIRRRLAVAPEARVRILEVGAGTGSTSRMIFRAVGEYGDRLQYVYTDVSPAFVRHGENKFGHRYPFVSYQTLDVEKSPLSQGFEPAGMDVVVATNVLHATRDIAKTLEHLRTVLRSGGWLVINELTQVDLFIALIFGITEGWWRFTDSGKRLPGSPLLDREKWRRALAEAGMGNIHFLGLPETAYQSVIVCASDGAAADTLAVITDPEPAAPETATHTLPATTGAADTGSPEAMKAGVLAYIKSVFSEALKIEVRHIDEQETFEMFGVDSLINMDIIERFEKDLGALSKTLLFEYITVVSLAEYFLENHEAALAEMLGSEAADDLPETIPARETTAIVDRDARPEPMVPAVTGDELEPRARSCGETETSDIAVIGIAGRYPMAEDLDIFWENLKAGRNAVTRIPENRWKGSRPSGNGAHKEGYPWGGFLSDVDRFDPLFFNIAPAEVEAMDPQERLFLETAWALIEDAGYTRDEFGKLGHRVGVFVGVLNADYEFLGAQHLAGGGSTGAHASYWSIANRVSYFLNFSGPSLAVDSACSSSLTALHLACRSIQCGDCRAAIAGGVNLILHPEHLNRWDDLNALSKEGRCKCFGAGADGFVPGEGVGAVLLKPLRSAERDRDRIYGVIKGSSINADGKTSGFTVPSPGRQAELVQASWREAGWEPDTVGYIEAHGTGTILGDPIEIAGLTKAFRRFTDARQHCAIGSVKSNIGHLESAAGIAGLTKVILQMRHRQLAPSINAREPNPKIEFQDSPFRLQRELADWDPPVIGEAQQILPRRAGVSSFGAGGANAHVLIEEYTHPDDDVPIPGHHLVVLSAHKPASLRRAARNLLTHLSRQGRDSSPRLDAIAWTLQTGREAMKERLAILAPDVAALAEKLRRFTSGEKEIPGLYMGRAHGQPSPVSSGGEEMALGETAEQWVTGAAVDWSGIWPHGHPRRISLPTYPFDRERYWIDTPAASERERGDETPSPPILRCVPESGEASFESRLAGDAYYLRDHRVLGQAVLPGVMGLEMARRAVEWTRDTNDFQLAHVMWLRPVVVEGDSRTVRVDLEPGDGRVRFQMKTRGGTGPDTPAMKGEAVFGGPDGLPPKETADLAAIRDRCRRRVDREAFYRGMAAKGLGYGPSMQAVETLRYNDTEAVARLVLPASVAAAFTEYGLHPAIMDGALQATCALLPGGLGRTETLWLPFALGNLTIHGRIPRTCHAHVRLARPSGESTGRLHRFHIRILDDRGELRLEMADFTVASRRVDAPLAAAGDPDEHLYLRRVWRAGPGTASSPSRGGGNTIVFLEHDGAIREAFKSWESSLGEYLANTRLISVRTGDRFEEAGPGAYRVNPAMPADYVRLLETLRVDGMTPSAIACLWPAEISTHFDGQGLEAQFSSAVEPVFLMTRALMKSGLKAAVRLFYLYRETDGPGQALHAAMGGFARTARLENPNVHIRVVGVGEDGTAGPLAERMARVVSRELRLEDGRTVDIRHAGGERWIQTVEEVPMDRENPPPELVTPGGVYLVTGGGGALGSRFAAYLVEKGAGTIVLSGRSRQGAAVDEVLKTLSENGGVAVYEQADLGRIEEADALVQSIRARFGGIHGILHAAGVIRDALIVNKNMPDFYEVAGPKVFGTTCLDYLTRNDPLEFFVMFSSIAAQLGNLGQGDYAFCNSFMDHFARYRDALRRKGERSGRTLSINWPLWNEGAMSVDEIARQRLRRAGYTAISAETGLRAFDETMALSMPQVMFIAGDREKIMGGLGMEKESERNRASSSPGNGKTGLQVHVEKVLTGFCVDILKVREKDLDPMEKFEGYGMDSVYMLKVLNRIEAHYDRTVAPEAIVDHPTIRELAAYLIDKGIAHGKAPEDEEEGSREEESPAENENSPGNSSKTAFQVRPDITRENPEDTRVAVIGMACRFPGSNGIEAYWRNLAEGRHLVSPFPGGRWRAGAFAMAREHDGIRDYARWGAFIDGIHRFDAGFFKISEPDAIMMDPQHRILLEVSQELMDDAGYDREAIRLSRTGVFLGGAESTYTRACWDRIPESSQKHLIPCMIQNMMAARIANFYDFKGPAIMLDTACSSSLVAIDQACRSLADDQCDMAMAGGVDLILDPLVYLGFGRSGVLANGDRSHVFDRRADGFTIGEGAGLVLLKPLAAAMVDGDRVYGIIRGTAVNNDGNTMGATVPSLEGQKSVIRSALASSGVPPETISLLEAHGTGTLLGDPIEIKAISQVYREHTDRRGYCAVGSVKSNMGHLLRAAGVASFIKIMLSLAHGRIPPTLHCDDPHPRFDFEASPFYPAIRPENWEPGAHGRRAAVSSFGFGGTNCHVIAEEMPADLAYAPTRRALPKTVFNRKTYRLGEDAVPAEREPPDAVPAASFDEDALRDLLSRLQRGELTVEMALAQEAG